MNIKNKLLLTAVATSCMAQIFAADDLDCGATAATAAWQQPTVKTWKPCYSSVALVGRATDAANRKATGHVSQLLGESAAVHYAQALINGQYPDDGDIAPAKALASDTAYHLVQSDNESIISFPNAIPAFLATHVTDKTSDVHGMIGQMDLNPHIAEHMKHSVGYYYENPHHPWTKSAAEPIQDKLNDMAREYRLLDDAVKADSDLTGVKYIVIPDVGATDAVITSRTDELDVLFEAHPHLTLVVAFADDVRSIDDIFCFDAGNKTSTLSTHVTKLSVTGKHLQTVGDCFFAKAISLTSVDFWGLGALQNAEDGFFAGARVLRSVDFWGLGALHTVGGSFFFGANALTSVDFKGLGALQNVGSCFFMNAKNLTSMHFLDDLSGALILSAYDGSARIIIDAEAVAGAAVPAAEGAAAADADG